jgi:hypothetical protein
LVPIKGLIVRSFSPEARFWFYCGPNRSVEELVLEIKPFLFEFKNPYFASLEYGLFFD